MEVSRTYFVYAPTLEIVERAVTAGANSSTLETLMSYDNYGRASQVNATGRSVQSFTYNTQGE